MFSLYRNDASHGNRRYLYFTWRRHLYYSDSDKSNPYSIITILQQVRSKESKKSQDQTLFKKSSATQAACDQILLPTCTKSWKISSHYSKCKKPHHLITIQLPRSKKARMPNAKPIFLKRQRKQRRKRLTMPQKQLLLFWR